MKTARYLFGATFIALGLMVFPVNYASAVMVNLDSWNVAELNASGDFVELNYSSDGATTTVTLQWMAGASNQLTALGIDKFYYNCELCSFTSNPNDDESGKTGGIISVAEGVTDVTGDWSTHGGGLAGDGFGDFNSRGNADSASTGGITEQLIFVLTGDLSFLFNDHDARFAVHVRYGNDCSGWASDGEPSGEPGSNPSCAAVPEPSSVALLGIGVLLLAGMAAWRRPKIVSRT
jgi:PEP-CTERM motif